MSTQTRLTDPETADLTQHPTTDVVDSRSAGDGGSDGADHAAGTTAGPSGARIGEQNQADGGRAHEVGAPAGDVRDELTVDRSGDTAAGLDRPGPDGTALDRTGIDGTALDQTVPVRSGFDGTGLGEITLDGTRLSATGLDRTGPDGAGGGGRRAGLAGCGAGDGDRLARAGLSRVVEPGDLKALKMFDGMAASEVWEMLLRKSRGTERWSARLAEVQPERDLERAAAMGARFVIPGDDEWPEQMDVLAEAGQLTRRAGVPFGLWVRGPVNLRHSLERSVAMVGARASSSYGEHVAAELSSGMADNGFTIVSGGAFGIDAAAHRGALAASGVTIAVLASGVDVLYPRRNSALLSRISEQGLVVSELPPGCSPTRLRFLSRNRLIAAGTLGVVVIEAAVRSGALNSAGWAEQCGRAVLAVPGPITSRMSEGSHLLVRERGAVLVTNVAEIIEALSPLGTHLAPHPAAPSTPHDHLDHDLRRTLDAVPVINPAPATRIAISAGLDLATTQECLETLADLALVEYEESGWRLAPTAHPSPTA